MNVVGLTFNELESFDVAVLAVGGGLLREVVVHCMESVVELVVVPSLANVDAVDLGVGNDILSFAKLGNV